MTQSKIHLGNKLKNNKNKNLIKTKISHNKNNNKLR